MKTLLKATLASALLSGFAAPAAFAADVVIGVPNWPSVRVTAHVLKVVMEDNFGLEVELQNGSNPVVFEAMDTGSMHVHPEVWLPNQTNLHNKFVKEKKTLILIQSDYLSRIINKLRIFLAIDFSFICVADLRNKNKQPCPEVSKYLEKTLPKPARWESTDRKI